MAENLPNLGRKIDIHFQETQRTSNKLNLNRTTLRHIVIKLAKVKDKEFRKQQEKRENLYTRNLPNKLSMDFSTETVQARREWDDIFKILKEKTVNQEYYTWQSLLSEMKEG